jgi:hypothetical protein
MCLLMLFLTFQFIYDISLYFYLNLKATLIKQRFFFLLLISGKFSYIHINYIFIYLIEPRQNPKTLYAIEYLAACILFPLVIASSLIRAWGKWHPKNREGILATNTGRKQIPCPVPVPSVSVYRKGL